jgi:hypothetical protein
MEKLLKECIRQLVTESSIITEGTCVKCGQANVMTTKLNGKDTCYYGCGASQNVTVPEPEAVTQASTPENVFKLTGPTKTLTSKQFEQSHVQSEYMGKFEYLGISFHELTIKIDSVEEGRALGFDEQGSKDILADGGTFTDKFGVVVAFDVYKNGGGYGYSSRYEMDGHQVVGIQYYAHVLAMLSFEDAEQLDSLVDVNSDDDLVIDAMEQAAKDAY